MPARRSSTLERPLEISSLSRAQLLLFWLVHRYQLARLRALVDAAFAIAHAANNAPHDATG